MSQLVKLSCFTDFFFSSENQNHSSIFKCQPHKMVTHSNNSPAICLSVCLNCLSVYDHFVGLVFKGLNH